MKDIVLITADSLRLDYVSYFCADSPADTPNLDEMAAGGSAYPTTVANGPYTVMSVPSLLTGEYQPAITSNTSTLAELLSQNGYSTAGFCTNMQVIGPRLKHMELTRGFDTFDTCLDSVRENTEVTLDKIVHGTGLGAKKLFGEDSTTYRKVASLVSHLPLPVDKPVPPAEYVNQRAIDWIDSPQNEGKNTFTWIFHLDTHEPWLPPVDWLDETPSKLERYKKHALNRKHRYFKETITDEDIQTIKELYRKTVEYWDEQIGELKRELERRGRNPIIIVTSDHGELFFEGGHIAHPPTWLEPLIRVPLIIDGIELKNNLNGAPVQNIDVVNTILDICDVPPRETNRGISLQSPERIKSRNGVVTVIGKNPLTVSYRTSEYKYVKVGDAESLYQVSESIDVTDDISNQHPEIVSKLRDKLKSELSDVDMDLSVKNSAVDEDIEDRLKSLGYVE